MSCWHRACGSPGAPSVRQDNGSKDSGHWQLSSWWEQAAGCTGSSRTPERSTSTTRPLRKLRHIDHLCILLCCQTLQHYNGQTFHAIGFRQQCTADAKGHQHASLACWSLSQATRLGNISARHNCLQEKRLSDTSHDLRRQDAPLHLADTHGRNFFSDCCYLDKDYQYLCSPASGTMNWGAHASMHYHTGVSCCTRTRAETLSGHF